MSRGSLDLGCRPLLLATNIQSQRDDLVRTPMNGSMPLAGSPQLEESEAIWMFAQPFL